MRVVVTGGAGFLGRAIVRTLVERGDAVVALVRDAERAAHLVGEGVTLVASDLSDRAAMETAMRGADGVIHAAGSYRLGIKAAEREAMRDANVGTTERVLDAAIAASVPRIVYVSTCGVFGDTKGKVVDETYRRDPADGFLSWYDVTKVRAHEVAEARIAGGAPIVIVQPSQIYGPDDHFATGEQLGAAYAGKLAYTIFSSAGVGWIHVRDLARGIVTALERGRVGEAYVLSGPRHRLGESMAIAARAGGHRPPRLSVPTALVRFLAPFNDRLVHLPGMPDNLAETIRATDGVTYWATSAKAEGELGFTARSLEQGVRDTFGGETT
jgi:nucleoside-diphosphate-sugar epimerase